VKPSRWIVIAAGVIALVVLFLIVRPSGQDEPKPTVSPTGTPIPSSTGSTGVTAVEIEVAVAGGQVSGSGEAEVTQGDLVRIVVTADVTDEVHLHGYDLHADVTPDAPGVIEFTADAPGVYEVELEDAGLLLLELTVSP
jgi:FtsP/CotA-like multicopper oxidase with cupredoxin domain